MLSRPRLIALAATLAVAIVAVVLIASGGDGDEERAAPAPERSPTSKSKPEPEKKAERSKSRDSSAVPRAAPQDGPYRPSPDTEEGQAFETVTDVYDVVKDGRQSDAQTICDLMTEKARAETQEYARRVAGIADYEWTCARSVGLLVGAAKRYGNFRPTENAEVIGINVDGQRATASVRFGKRGRVQTVSLVKEDGEWKLGSAPRGAG